jgi:hypothetical protein
MFSGAIDYVSANAGGGAIPASANEAITAYQNNSATYLTAHQDISNLMPKSESANFYPMTGNPSGFINELPNTEEVEFEEIDLSSFATSSQINELSGAIDYVSANAGGGGATGGYNETVLYDNINGSNSGCILSEPITNFRKIEISYGNGNGRQIMQVDPRLCSGGSNVPLTIVPTFNNGYASIYTQSWRFSSTTAFVSGFKAKELWGNAAAVSARDANNLYVYGLTGINRIAGGN